MIEDLNHKYSRVGPTVIRNETKIKTKGEKRWNKVFDKEMQTKWVEQYKYLGQIVSFENQKPKEIKTRISNSWKAFWAQGNTSISKQSLKTKAKLLENGIFPVTTQKPEQQQKANTRDLK